MLSQLRVFAQSYDIHMWFIAHPTKMMRDTSGKVPVPKGYDISGSASFFSKADLGITVHRPDPSNSTLAEIHCWKCRYSWVGKQGDTVLNYDPITSSYDQVKPKGIYDEFLIKDDAPSF
jgi:twinkle protein